MKFFNLGQSGAALKKRDLQDLKLMGNMNDYVDHKFEDITENRTFSHQVGFVFNGANVTPGKTDHQPTITYSLNKGRANLFPQNWSTD